MRETQILCHLKFLDKHFDLLINFNVPLIKECIKKLYYNLCVFVSLWLNYYIFYRNRKVSFYGAEHFQEKTKLHF